MESNNELIKKDVKYKELINNIALKYRNSQIKAATSVNREMLLFFWELGKDMDVIKNSSSWGSHFYEHLSFDLRKLLPDVKSFSERNLLYMHQFYKMYPNAKITPQIDAHSDDKAITHQLDAQLDEQNIFDIPWGHNKLIMDKCKDDQEKALFFVNKTIENNWSRSVLLNFLDTNLYERQGKAITNFSNTLPEIGSDLAKEITKDPYNFDFLTLRENYDEKELKDALMANIQSFLLELGKGFAFIGKEYRLVVGETEQFLDMLFYNVQKHCYVVIEIKTRQFEPGDMGQLGTYVAAVDGILKTPQDNPSVGLLICKTKDNVLAQYALNAVNVPTGVSEYEMSHLLPEDYRSSLPTIEEIEKELGE